jgi:hypothetical protein
LNSETVSDACPTKSLSYQWRLLRATPSQ